MKVLITTLSIYLTLVVSYDENSCAYFSNHVVATPMTTCAAYSHQSTQYSWNFQCDDADNVQCNYYMMDTECNANMTAGSTLVDSVAGEIQCVGSGANCHTVDVNITGFTTGKDASSDKCDPTDFFTFSFVIDECIPSRMGGVSSSAILSCDAEKLYFEYYSGTGNCDGDSMETYTYEYYQDLDGCWDIVCGTHEEYGEGTPSDQEPEQPPQEAPACELEYKGHNNKEIGRELLQMLIKPMDATKAKFMTSKKRAFQANVLNGGEWDAVERGSGAVANSIIMNWIYIVAVACAVILIAGAWRFIKQKEYTIL